MPDELSIVNRGNFSGSGLFAEQELGLGSFCVVVVEVILRRTRVADVIVAFCQGINYERSLSFGELVGPFLNLVEGKTGVTPCLGSTFEYIESIVISFFVVLAGVVAIGEL